jgi:hypothetical protein
LVSMTPAAGGVPYFGPARIQERFARRTSFDSIDRQRWFGCERSYSQWNAPAIESPVVREGQRGMFAGRAVAQIR